VAKPFSACRERTIKVHHRWTHKGSYVEKRRSKTGGKRLIDLFIFWSYLEFWKGRDGGLVL
jgi:hypothetical protein